MTASRQKIGIAEQEPTVACRITIRRLKEDNGSVIVDGHLPRLLDSVGKRLAHGTVTSA
jgi:hypothetical protein